MSPRLWSFSRLGLFAILVLAVIALAGSRFRRFMRVGEEGEKVWFYDQSADRLYAVSRDTIPPDQGIDQAKGDGVRAVVLSLGQNAGPRIAYLETYTPELKQLLERIQASRISHHSTRDTAPPRDSKYYQDNELVRRPHEPQWYAVSTAEGRRILSEWRSWRGPQGQAPVVCAPAD